MTGPRSSDSKKSGLTDLGRAIDQASRQTDQIGNDVGLSRFDRAINLVAEVAGVTVLASIVILVFANAVGRYALQATFIWGDEMVLSLLPWLGMLGMFLSVRRRQIIRIDFFVNSLPAGLRRLLDVSASLFAAAAFIYLALISFEYLQLFGGDRTIYLGLRKGWFMSALAIGPALAAAAYLWLAWEDARGRRGRIQ